MSDISRVSYENLWLADAKIVSILRQTSIIPSLIAISDTPLVLGDVKLIFPLEISGNARLRYDNGIRIIDWESTEWVAYEKDGVKWYKDNLTEDDFKNLFLLLVHQIKIWGENSTNTQRLEKSK
jgi:hypothetical protein